MPILRGTHAAPILSSTGQGAAGNWWDPNVDGLCVWAAYQPKGAASLAASYLDLSGNGNNAGVGVAPTWDAVNGWIFNGSTQYLTTTFLPETDQSQSVMIAYTNAASGYNFMFGGAGAGARLFRASRRATDSIFSNGGQVIAGAGNAAGTLGVAGNQGYQDGVAVGGAIEAWGAGGAFVCYIGCLNNLGVASLFQACRIQALAIYNCVLTGTQMAALHAAMAAL